MVLKYANEKFVYISYTLGFELLSHSSLILDKFDVILMNLWGVIHMLTQEAMEYLKNTFGTFQTYACKYCSNNVNCERLRRQRGNDIGCALLTYAELFSLKEIHHNTPDKRVDRIVNSIYKLKLLGYKMTVDAPWVIFKNDTTGNYIWMHPEKRIYNGNIYRKLDIMGDFMVCEDDNGLHAFYFGAPEYDLLDGIPNLGKSVPYKRYNSTNKRVLMLKFNAMNKVCTLLTDCFANRLLVIGIEDGFLRTDGTKILLEGVTCNKDGSVNKVFVRADSNLKVIKTSSGVATMEV